MIMNLPKGEKSRAHVQRLTSGPSQIAIGYMFFFFRNGCMGVWQVHRSYIGLGLEGTSGRIQGVSWHCPWLLRGDSHTGKGSERALMDSVSTASPGVCSIAAPCLRGNIPIPKLLLAMGGPTCFPLLERDLMLALVLLLNFCHPQYPLQATHSSGKKAVCVST